MEKKKAAVGDFIGMFTNPNDPMYAVGVFLTFLALLFFGVDAAQVAAKHWVLLRRRKRWLLNIIMVYLAGLVAWIELTFCHEVITGFLAGRIGLTWPFIDSAYRLLLPATIVVGLICLVLRILHQLVRGRVDIPEVPIIGDPSQSVRSYFLSYKAAIGSMLLLPPLKRWVMSWGGLFTMIVGLVLHALCLPGALLLTINIVLFSTDDYPGAQPPSAAQLRTRRGR